MSKHRRLTITDSGRARSLSLSATRCEGEDRDQLEEGRREYSTSEHPYAGFGRPATWAECLERGHGTEHACPYVSCAAHLYSDVLETGSLKLNFPDREPTDLAETCLYTVAAKGEHTLEASGALLNLTRERTRQVEILALAELQAAMLAAGVDP